MLKPKSFVPANQQLISRCTVKRAHTTVGRLQLVNVSISHGWPFVVICCLLCNVTHTTLRLTPEGHIEWSDCSLALLLTHGNSTLSTDNKGA